MCGIRGPCFCQVFLVHTPSEMCCFPFMPLFPSHSPLTSSESLPDGSWPELISSAICTHGCPLFFILAAPGDTRFHWLLVFQKDISVLFPARTEVLFLVVVGLPGFLNFQAGSVLIALNWGWFGPEGAAALFHSKGHVACCQDEGSSDAHWGL